MVLYGKYAIYCNNIAEIGWSVGRSVSRTVGWSDGRTDGRTVGRSDGRLVLTFRGTDHFRRILINTTTRLKLSYETLPAQHYICTCGAATAHIAWHNSLPFEF